ncbi:MAG: methionyl-tRNA formyltransferase [Gemmatimonadales bacterium]|nr:methionyl-tRNA formyltransferase [Gemmatimonadales bacterium]
MRLVFFGTPDFAVPSLRALVAEGHQVVAAVTQPDRAQGRSRSRLLPPPVKVAAEEHGIEVHQPERPTGDVFLHTLRHCNADLGIVVAYGHVLRPEVLAVPRLGMLNVHASLLPRLRGAAPIHWAILRGERVTGVCIMQMEAGLDSGPVYRMADTPIGEAETSGQLTARLAALGAAALLDVLTELRAGTAKARTQDHALATWAPKIARDDARVDWHEDAAAVARRIRAMDPEPGAWAQLDGQEVKLFGARVLHDLGSATPPGTVLEAHRVLHVQAGRGVVEVGEVQPAGKKRMPVTAWVNGRGIGAGQQLA